MTDALFDIEATTTPVPPQPVPDMWIIIGTWQGTGYVVPSRWRREYLTREAAEKAANEAWRSGWTNIHIVHIPATK